MIKLNKNHIFYIYIAFIAFILVYHATYKALWYDELFTYYVSNQNSFFEVISSLLAGIDNGPPLDYVVRFLGLKSFGDSEIIFRLPSLVLYILTVYILYLYIKENTDYLTAFIAVTVFVASYAKFYAIEGRPYAFLLFSCISSIFFYYKVTVSNKYSYKILFFISLISGPYSHYYGILNYFPVIINEAIAYLIFRKKRKDIIYIILFSIILLASLIPFAINAVEMKEYFWGRAFGIETALTYYKEYMEESLVIVIFVSVIALVSLYKFHSKASVSIKYDYVVISLSCLAMPAFLYVIAKLATNAMLSRYAVQTCLGISLFSGYVIYAIIKNNYLKIICVLFGVVISLNALGNIGYTKKSTAKELVSRLEEKLNNNASRVFVSSKLLFVQLHHYCSDYCKNKLYFINDRRLFMKHSGSDTSVIALQNLSRSTSYNLVDFHEMINLYGEDDMILSYGDNWLLNELISVKGDVYTIESLKNDLSFYKL